ncbi:MAG: preprotein translocase subunit SecG [Pseudomonadota bacterium]
METVLLVVHIMVVIALIVMVLLQRTEGGALGIGGGGGGNMKSTRQPVDFMTKVTTVLALCFFLTSIGIAIIAQTTDDASDILERIQTNTAPSSSDGGGGGVLDALDGELAPTSPAVPVEPASPSVPTGN